MGPVCLCFGGKGEALNECVAPASAAADTAYAEAIGMQECR